MRKEITLLLQELERRDTAEREQGMSRAERARNLRPEAGRFLNLLIRIARPRLIVEVGTSNGYSTLWLAEAAQAVGGSVISLEVRDAATTKRRRTWRRQGWPTWPTFAWPMPMRRFPASRGRLTWSFSMPKKRTT